MSRSTLFAVPLALSIIGSSYAQQVPASYTKPAQSSEASSSSTATMTPRQIAEMQGDILMARKEYPSAANTYRKILDSDPKNAQLLNKVGVAYQQLGDLDRAERYYKKSIHAEKSYASPINN